MKTTWKWSMESEANRLLQAARNIGNGFYLTHNFQVLSTNEPYSANSVQIPPLPYQEIPQFWESVRDIDLNCLPANDPHNLTSNLLALLPTLDPPDTSQLKSTWHDNEEELLAAIARELPSINLPQHLTIYSTYFGTTSSFSNHTSQAPNITLFLRQDATLHHLVEGILSSLLRDYHDNAGFSWSESEAIIDHIVTISPLGTILRRIDSQKHLGTIPSLQLATSAQSLAFLRKIGANTTLHHLELIENSPAADNKQLHHLTTRESKVLCELIAKAGQTLSYDDIADLIFDKDEDYSLAVICKTIERLRTKLEKNGITGSLIVTDRARGYYLNS